MSKPLSESTIKMYDVIMNKIANDTGTKRDATESFLRDTSKIIAYVSTKNSEHTKKNYYATILSFVRRLKFTEAIIAKYDAKMMESAAEVEANYESNQMSDKQKANWITSSELKSVINKLKADVPTEVDTYAKYRKLIRYLVILIHSYLPLRNDLVNAKLYKDSDKPATLDKKINYIIIGSNPHIVLNNYKTEKTYGEKVLPLNAECASELLKYYDELTSFSEAHWFLVRENEDDHLTNKNFIDLFQSAFGGKKIGSTMLRHVAVSELYQVSPEQYKKEEALASVMTHSVGTARLKYAKVLN